MWLIGFHSLKNFPIKCFYYMNVFYSPLQNWLMSNVVGVTFRGPKSKFKLKMSTNGFLVWIPWHSYDEKQQIVMISMVLNGKTWIFILFWLFSLQFDALCGLLVCDHTHQKTSSSSPKE